MSDCLKICYEKGGECERRCLDELGALLEDSLDGVLNFCGLRVITVGCEYRVDDTAQRLNTYETGAMGRAVTTSARREKETRRVCGIVCGGL